MNGHHEQLARVATESIVAEGDLEQKIVEKLKEISDKCILKITGDLSSTFQC